MGWDLAPRDKAFALLAVALEDDKASNVISFLSSKRSTKLGPVIEKLLVSNARGRKTRLIKELQKMELEPHFMLDEIDPSWIAQALLKERPQATALVLAHMPQTFVGEVLEHLPPSFKESLPEKTTGLKINRQILKVSEEVFAKKFLRPVEPPTLDSFGIREIGLLKSWELQAVIKGLGCYMVALAFKGVSEKALVELVRSLSDEDAKELFDIYKELGEPDKGTVKEAQVLLLSLSANFDHVSDLIAEAGVTVMAKAIYGLPEDLIRVVRQRCAVRQGHFINRVIDECSSKAVSRDYVKSYKDLVLNIVKKLSSAGKIDQKWSKIKFG